MHDYLYLVIYSEDDVLLEVTDNIPKLIKVNVDRSKTDQENAKLLVIKLLGHAYISQIQSIMQWMMPAAE